MSAVGQAERMKGQPTNTPFSPRLRWLIAAGVALVIAVVSTVIVSTLIAQDKLPKTFQFSLIWYVLGLLLLAVAIIPNQRGGVLVTASTLFGFAFLYLPILMLIIFSFNDSRSNATWEGFTLRWYQDLIQGGAALALGTDQSVTLQTGLFDYLRNSLIVASIATLISTTLGTAVAIGMERFRFWLRPLLSVVLYLPIMIPDMAMGIAMSVFFNLIFDLLAQFGISARLGFPTIIIAHVAFATSFVAVVVRARLAGMDPSLEEAAADSGANEWQTFRRIVLPLIAPGIIGGALLAFTLSLDDYVITFFTAGVGTSTLPIYVFGLVRFSVTPAINALSTIMISISMVLVAISMILQRQR